MNNTFVTFQRFSDPELATATAEKLKENNLEVQLEGGKFLDPSFPGTNSLDADIELKLKQTDFAKAENILESFYNTSIESVDKDYYLFQFTTAELKEVIFKPDEWGKFDYQLAQKLLKEKGIYISEEEISALKNQRTKQLAEPEKVSPRWIIAGYAAAFFGGFIGIIFGWIVAYSRKTLPDGSKVFTYGEKYRRHGRRIFQLSLVTFTLTLILRLKYSAG